MVIPAGPSGPAGACLVPMVLAGLCLVPMVLDGACLVSMVLSGLCLVPMVLAGPCLVPMALAGPCLVPMVLPGLCCHLLFLLPRSLHGWDDSCQPGPQEPSILQGYGPRGTFYNIFAIFYY